MAYARQLPEPPDPLGLARRLAHLPGLSLLHSACPDPAAYARYSYVAAQPDAELRSLEPPLVDAVDAAEPAAGFCHVPRFIGVVPYEARRSLERPGWAPALDRRPVPLVSELCWQRYPAVVCVDHQSGVVMAVGDHRAAVEALVAAMRQSPAHSGAIVEAADPEDPARHIERVEAALELIGAGDIYQVNLCRRLELTLRAPQGSRSAALLDLYGRLIQSAPTAFGAFLSLPDGVTVLSTSPELLVDLERDRTGSGAIVRTAPIKGTRPRGHDARSDRRLARELDRDAKERAELTMIIDVERNDLGRIATPGSVRVTREPALTTHRTIHHRDAWLAARARPRVTRADVLEALLPSGSVTGAPKIRAMEVIASLEPHRRGLYTGGLGLVARDGSVRMSMAIRTCVFREGEGEYLTGGGIVIDSRPEVELEETTWKSAQLRRALGGG